MVSKRAERRESGIEEEQKTERYTGKGERERSVKCGKSSEERRKDNGKRVQRRQKKKAK